MKIILRMSNAAAILPRYLEVHYGSLPYVLCSFTLHLKTVKTLNIRFSSVWRLITAEAQRQRLRSAAEPGACYTRTAEGFTFSGNNLHRSTGCHTKAVLSHASTCTN